MILGFDPGRDKCGIAVMDKDKKLHYHQVVLASEVDMIIGKICEKFAIDTMVIGDRTTSMLWEEKLRKILPDYVEIIKVDERYSTLEGRDRYWEMYPPKGLVQIIPQGMRIPPRAIDDIVAIILIEKYLESGNKIY